MVGRLILPFLLSAALMLLAPAAGAQVIGEGPGYLGAGFQGPMTGQYGFSPPQSGFWQGGAYGGTEGSGVAVGSPYPHGGLGVPITSNKALEIVERYLSKTNNDDLYPARIFEYNTHFEAELKEKESARGAFELIVDKFSGRVYPETGPNIVWNNKYGLNGNYFGVQPVGGVSVNQALETVGDFIRRTSPDLKVEGDVTEYYGYFEFHVSEGGKLAVEANVNSFNGQLWIENWHGSLLREVTMRR